MTRRLAVTPASDSSVLVRWRFSCWDPSGMLVAVTAAALRRASEKVGRHWSHRRSRDDGLAGSVRAIRGR
jgi:hypothetical protein